MAMACRWACRAVGGPSWPEPHPADAQALTTAIVDAETIKSLYLALDGTR